MDWNAYNPALKQRGSLTVWFDVEVQWLSPPVALGHIGIDTETPDIRALEVTSNSIGDEPVLPDLLCQILRDEEISSAGGDGACDTNPQRCARMGVVDRLFPDFAPVPEGTAK